MNKTMLPDPSRRHALVRGATALGAATMVGGATPADTITPTEAGSGTILNARAFGAVGDGKTNDTAALQRAIDRAKAMPGGATVFLPAGRYVIDRLNFRPVGRDDFQRRIIVQGEGAGRTILMPAGIGAVLLDAAGCNNLRIEALTIDSGRLPSKAALLLGRTRASPNCNGATFADLVLEGSYSLATIVSIAAETTRWINCRVSNGHADARHCCLITGTEPGTIAGLDDAALVAGPNTDNVMTGCVFYAPYERARLLRFSVGAGFAFFGCSLLAGDARGAQLVVYTDPRDGIFNGPVAWHGCHFEVTAPDSCVHWIEAPPGESYWRNLAIHGGYAVVLSDTPLVDFDRSNSRRRPIVQAMLLQVPALPPGVTGADVCSFAFLDCDLSFIGEGGAIVAPGFVRNCRIDARDLRTPQVAGRPVRVARDRSRRQTFGSGMIVENSDPTEGDLGSWIVVRDGAGTIEAADGRGGAPMSGEIVDVGGQRHPVWRRASGGQLTLERTASAPSGFAVPKFERFNT